MGQLGNLNSTQILSFVWVVIPLTGFSSVIFSWVQRQKILRERAQEIEQLRKVSQWIDRSMSYYDRKQDQMMNELISSYFDDKSKGASDRLCDFILGFFGDEDGVGRHLDSCLVYRIQAMIKRTTNINQLVRFATCGNSSFRSLARQNPLYSEDIIKIRELLNLA